jgi:hypothetical protein
VEVEVRGVCRTRGVHERAGLPLNFLARFRTDTMVGHVVGLILAPQHGITVDLYRFERVKDQHARGARGAGARYIFDACVRSEVTALHVYSFLLTTVDSFPSAVLTNLRIAEGRYGTREADEQWTSLRTRSKATCCRDTRTS